MRALRALLVAGVATLAFPAASLAADPAPSNSTVTGTVGTELSITAPNVDMGTLRHGTNTASGGVTVTSTSDWWLTAVDPAATDKGKLVRVGAGLGTPVLGNPIVFTLGPAVSGLEDPDLAVSGGLASPLTESGTLSDTVPVAFSQTVGNDEDLKEGEAYQMTVEYTATSTAPVG
jgi:hypothetical protein